MPYPYHVNDDVFHSRWLKSRAVFGRGANRYCVGIDEENVHPAQTHLRAYKSVDAGQTWTEQDAANRPLMYTVASGSATYNSAQFDAIQHPTNADRIIIGYVDNTLAYAIVEFDMAADTWGVPIAGGPTGDVVHGSAITGDDCGNRSLQIAYRPSDTSYWLLYQGPSDATPPARGATGPYDRVYLVQYNGAWQASQLCFGPLGEDNDYYPKGMALDPATDRLHLFAIKKYWPGTAAGIPPQVDLLHRSLTAADVLNAVQVISAVYGRQPSNNASYPFVAGGRIVTAFASDIQPPIANVARRWPTVAYGALADSPAWTVDVLSTAVADEIRGSVGNIMSAPNGTDIWAFWDCDFTTKIKYSRFNGSVWTAPTLHLDGTAQGYTAFGDYIVGRIVDAGAGKLGLLYLADGAWYYFSYVYDEVSLGAPPPPPPAPGGVAATAQPLTAGYPIFPPIVKYPNQYDQCLACFGLTYRKLRPRRVYPITTELPNGIEMPLEGREFYEQEVIVTPTTVSGDNVVVSFDVPTGYDGLLYGLVLWYTGTGFVQGSGDILWRVKVGNAWPRNLGNVRTALGLPYQPFTLSDFIRLYSGQTVQIIVNVPNAGGAIQIGASNIICAGQGWFYPV